MLRSYVGLVPLLMIGCRAPTTELDLTIRATVPVSSLAIVATALPSGKMAAHDFAAPSLPLPVSLLLPDSATSVSVSVTATATDGTSLGSAATIAVVARQRSEATLDLVADHGGAAMVTVLAGALGGAGWSDGTGSDARFSFPIGLGVDGTTLYVGDAGNSTVRAIALLTGAVSTVAGKAFVYESVDGAAGDARFASPNDVVADGAGHLYVGDHDAQVIRKIVLAGGAVSTVAGTPFLPGTIDGTGAAVRFRSPGGFALDGSGNLYVADETSHTIRQLVVGSGVVTTLAGKADMPGSTDATGGSARFNLPRGLALDGAGSKLYVADDGNDTIRVVALPGGAVSTVAGLAGMNGNVDAVGAAARFSSPRGLALDGAGNLEVADTFNGEIRRVVPSSGQVTTLAGAPGVGNSDGAGAVARFNQPLRAAADAQGNLYVSDWQNHTIRKLVLATGAVSTLAGVPPQHGGSDGAGAAARFDAPVGVIADGSGNVFVADRGSATIRQIVVATGVVTTLAGQAYAGGSSDGVGAAARFNGPFALAWDGADSLYVAEADNQLIRRVTISTRAVVTLAGAPGMSGSSDGVAGVARFSQPSGIAVGSDGNLYVADSGNHTLRRLTLADRNVTTVVGMAGMPGFVDAMGTAARLNNPTGLAAGSGILWLADSYNHAVRAIDLASLTVTTLAGSATPGSSDGTGTSARFSTPTAISFDGKQSLYVADTLNSTVRRIALPAATVTTWAGVAGQFKVIPGPLPAELNTPAGIAALPGGGFVVTAPTENAVLLVR